MSGVMGDAAQVVAEDVALDFRKSFLATRLIVGVIGVALPIALVVGDALWFDQPWFRPSISDYYNSGMRDWFVGSLWAIGAGLLVYMATRRNDWDNRISIVAGVLAILVAQLPTNVIGVPATPGNTLHLALAVALLFLLGVICFRFGRRDRVKPEWTESRRKGWQRVHFTCAITIWVSIAIVALSVWSGVFDRYSPLIFEALAIFAFGFSWSAKGSELFNLSRLEKGKPAVLSQQTELPKK
ncbi:MAG TPA: DUF998 domain-containing protein [Propionibacteriaceae bacterium]